MKFRTEYESQKSELRLSPHKKIMTFGSCFSENICRRMRDHLWDAISPAGVLYNPASIATALRFTALNTTENTIPAWSIVENGGFYHSLFFDSGFSGKSKVEVEEKVETLKGTVQTYLTEGADIIVTFGTAWVYETSMEYSKYINVGLRQIVGNCHKLPSRNFTRRLLSVEEIVNEWRNVVEAFSLQFPKIKLIFTVSPVRHIKDGLEGNSLSKAILRIAIEKIIELAKSDPALSNIQVDYFPAFEILTDDLRDYRFYASDLVHPSDSAVDYIWDKFSGRYLSEECRNLLNRCKKIVVGLNHRPIIETEEETSFRKDKLQTQWEILSKEWPEILNPFG